MVLDDSRPTPAHVRPDRHNIASVALAVGTTVIINAGRARYAWVTLVPLSFVAITTLTAGVLSVRDNFYPMAIGPDAAKHFQGYLNSTVTVVMMVCVVVILASAVLRWIAVLSRRSHAEAAE